MPTGSWSVFFDALGDFLLRVGLWYSLGCALFLLAYRALKSWGERSTK